MKNKMFKNMNIFSSDYLILMDLFLVEKYLHKEVCIINELLCC